MVQDLQIELEERVCYQNPSLVYRKTLEEELDEFVRKNVSLTSSEQESQKYFHNHVKKPFFQPKKIVEDEEGNLMLMITNGEESVEGLVEESKGEDGGGPKEIVVGPGEGKTLKTVSSKTTTTLQH